MNLIAAGILYLSLLSCGDDEDSVSQSVEIVDINFVPQNPTLSFEAQNLDIQVVSSADWGVSTVADFVKLSRRGGTSGETVITATIDANSSNKSRTATINFVSGGNSFDYIITQNYDTETYGDNDNSGIEAPAGYELVWHDEFDGSELSSDWNAEYWQPGHVNNELQYYRNEEIDGIKTIEVKDNHLNINCFKASDGNVYSGRINAKVKEGWKYGYIEASIKLPKGKGTWPAFWMMPVDVDWVNEGWPLCGEIDIMEEVGYNPNYVSSSLHAEGHVHTNNTQVTHEMFCEGAEDEFHTYAIEWTSERIITYVDGKVQLTYDSDGTIKNYPYDKAYYIILNLAWGGSWGGQKGVDESALPTTLEVDYVRVFQKK